MTNKTDSTEAGRHGRLLFTTMKVGQSVACPTSAVESWARYALPNLLRKNFSGIITARHIHPGEKATIDLP